VPIDTSVFTRSVTRLYLDGRFNNFVYQYYLANRAAIDQYKTPAEFARGFQNTSDAWNQLVTYAMKDSINLTRIPESDKKNIQKRIKAYMARLKWRTQGFYEVSNANDPIVARGKEVLNQ
jgi:carboxyl-terminal processing protease